MIHAMIKQIKILYQNNCDIHKYLKILKIYTISEATIITTISTIILIYGIINTSKIIILPLILIALEIGSIIEVINFKARLKELNKAKTIESEH